MIVFPKGFVKIKYPGYFWDTINKKFYSIKGGELRLMKYHKSFVIRRRWDDFHIEAGYGISVKGKQIRISLNYLNTLEYSKHKESVDFL